MGREGELPFPSRRSVFEFVFSLKREIPESGRTVINSVLTTSETTELSWRHLIGCGAGQRLAEEVKSVSNSRKNRPLVVEAVNRNQPEGVTSYRLLDSDGRLFPGKDCAPYTVRGRVELPEVPAGKYKVLYYDREDREVPQPHGYPAPLLELDEDLRIVTTPARFELAEHFRETRLERAELENRARLALVTTIESQARVIQQKDAASIDKEQSLTTAISQFVDMQGRAAQQQKDFSEFVVVQQEKFSEALMRAVDEAANRLAARTNWPEVVKEVVKEASSIGQLVISAARSVDRDDRGEKDDRPRKRDGGRLPGQSPTALSPATIPPVASDTPRASTAAEPAEREDEESWLLSLFGLSDSEPQAREPTAKGAPSQKKEPQPNVAQGAESDEPSEAAAPPAPEGKAGQTTALVHVDGAEAADRALLAIDAIATALDLALGGATGAENKGPRPVAWSPAWAWSEIKRRVRGLTEARIASLTSSAQSFLAFLRELGGIAAPVRQYVQGGTR